MGVWDWLRRRTDRPDEAVPPAAPRAPTTRLASLAPDDIAEFLRLSGQPPLPRELRAAPPRRGAWEPNARNEESRDFLARATAHPAVALQVRHEGQLHTAVVFLDGQGRGSWTPFTGKVPPRAPRPVTLLKLGDRAALYEDLVWFPPGFSATSDLPRAMKEGAPTVHVDVRPEDAVHDEPSGIAEACPVRSWSDARAQAELVRMLAAVPPRITVLVDDDAVRPGPPLADLRARVTAAGGRGELVTRTTLREWFYAHPDLRRQLDPQRVRFERENLPSPPELRRRAASVADRPLPPALRDRPGVLRAVVVARDQFVDNEGTDYLLIVTWIDAAGAVHWRTEHGGWEGALGMSTRVATLRPGDVLHIVGFDGTTPVYHEGPVGSGEVVR